MVSRLAGYGFSSGYFMTREPMRKGKKKKRKEKQPDTGTDTGEETRRPVHPYKESSGIHFLVHRCP
jgi:hypothetical protein